MDLVAMMTGFGLAAAAGSRAALVLVALGVFHHTGYFHLSEPFAWIASPVVLCVAAALGLVEVAAEAHPEVSELVTLAAYLPRAVVGFVALASATGHVDGNLLALAASGVLGAGTASATHYLRSKVRDVVHDTAGHASHHAGTGYSLLETLGAGSLVTASVFAPLLAAVAVLSLGVGTWFILRRAQAAVDAAASRVPAQAPGDARSP